MRPVSGFGVWGLGVWLQGSAKSIQKFITTGADDLHAPIDNLIHAQMLAFLADCRAGIIVSPAPNLSMIHSLHPELPRQPHRTSSSRSAGRARAAPRRRMR